MKDKRTGVHRVQVSITNGELEIIKVMEPLHDGSIEGAITNGIIKQVIDNTKED